MLAAPRFAQARKVAGLVFVLALHVAIGALLLNIAGRTRVESPAPSEEIVWLLPPPAPAAIKPKPRGGRPAPRAAASPPGPIYHGITLAPAAPAVGNLNQSLFGCAGSGFERLSPEARARCAGAQFAARPDESTVDYRDHVDRSRWAALWERGRQRKNGPLLLPCMDPHSPPGISLATLACLAKAASDGSFRIDEQPSYADTPPKVNVPYGGDPPDHSK